MIRSCPRGGEIDDSVRHRNVELQRRVGVDDGVGVGPRAEFLVRYPVGKTDELEVVRDLPVAAGEDERNLVAEHQLGAGDVQMPHGTGISCGSVEPPSTWITSKLWQSFMRLQKSSKVPARRPRAVSMMFGGPEVGPNATHPVRQRHVALGIRRRAS